MCCRRAPTVREPPDASPSTSTSRVSFDALDALALRETAVHSGLGRAVDASRVRLWARALGVDVERIDYDGFDASFQSAVRRADDVGSERRTIAADVSRSAHTFREEYLNEEELDEIRADVGWVLSRALSAHDGCHYYQGLHDVVAVLVLASRRGVKRVGKATTSGEEVFRRGMACAITERLVSWHLRDHTRKDLFHTLEMTSALLTLLERREPSLADALRKAKIATAFAIPWFMCWFLHGVTSLEVAARLIDVFIVSHPLMPVYVGLALMQANKEDILAAADDPMTLHVVLGKLTMPQPSGASSLENAFTEMQSIIDAALVAFEEVPPETLRLPTDADSASPHFPYPWMSSARDGQSTEKDADDEYVSSPLKSSVLPDDTPSAWPLVLIDDARMVMRKRRLRRLGLIGPSARESLARRKLIAVTTFAMSPFDNSARFLTLLSLLFVTVAMSVTENFAVLALWIRSAASSTTRFGVSRALALVFNERASRLIAL